MIIYFLFTITKFVTLWSWIKNRRDHSIKHKIMNWFLRNDLSYCLSRHVFKYLIINVIILLIKSMDQCQRLVIFYSFFSIYYWSLLTVIIMCVSIRSLFNINHMILYMILTCKSLLTFYKIKMIILKYFKNSYWS